MLPSRPSRQCHVLSITQPQSDKGIHELSLQKDRALVKYNLVTRSAWRAAAKWSAVALARERFLSLPLSRRRKKGKSHDPLHPPRPSGISAAPRCRRLGCEPRRVFCRVRLSRPSEKGFCEPTFSPSSNSLSRRKLRGTDKALTRASSGLYASFFSFFPSTLQRRNEPHAPTIFSFCMLQLRMPPSSKVRFRGPFLPTSSFPPAWRLSPKSSKSLWPVQVSRVNAHGGHQWRVDRGDGIARASGFGSGELLSAPSRLPYASSGMPLAVMA